MDLVTQLHDEADDEEELRDRAEQMARRAVRSKLKTALEMTPDISEALAAIAQVVEDDLAALTTEAFAIGAAHGRARAKMV